MLPVMKKFPMEGREGLWENCGCFESGLYVYLDGGGMTEGVLSKGRSEVSVKDIET